MVKKTYTYTDYDGNLRTEDFYFNLNEAELAFLLNSVNGGLSKSIDKILKSHNNVQIMKNFREIIRLAYGEKSLDGRRFQKSQEIFDNFAQTEAYSMLVMELMSDEKVAADFIQGILPKRLGEEAKKQTAGALVMGGAGGAVS